MSNPNTQKATLNITTAINKAVKQFGEYTLYDKGAHEIMALQEWVPTIKALEDQAVTCLREVLKHEHGDLFIREFLQTLEPIQEPWVDKIFQDEILSEYF